MFPTALSEVIEQAVKVGVGLLAAWMFRADVYQAVTALLFAVTISEGVALIVLSIRFHRDPAHLKPPKSGKKTGVKAILKLSIPVTPSACLIPLFGLVDSVLIVRLLKGHTESAVTLYGLFSGGAVTVINLPVSVCYGIAAASVPALSSAVKKGESGRKKLLYSLLLTIGISGASAVGLYCFAEPAVRILFRSLSGEELTTLVRLVRTFACGALTLSCTQTLAACLTALGKPSRAALSMLVAMLAKTALVVVLVGNPSVSIYGAAIATSIGYGISFLLNLWFAFRATRKNKRVKAA
jgi:stage V sporulation protein B